MKRIASKTLTAFLALTLMLGCFMISAKTVSGAYGKGFTGSNGSYEGEKVGVSSTRSYTATKKNGWIKKSGYWYYYKNGKKVRGWLKTGGKIYFLDKTNGRMVKGLTKIGNKYFYFTVKKTAKYPEGARITGWKNIKGKMYFFKTTGTMGERGRMLRREWVNVKGKWYFLNANGRRRTGWLTWKGKRYYLYRDAANRGEMKIGWLLWKGKYYYFQGPNGDMAVNTTLLIDGKRYKFDSKGVYYK